MGMVNDRRGEKLDQINEAESLNSHEVDDGHIDHKLFGVFLYKPKNRNPNDRNIHVDPKQHLSFKRNIHDLKCTGSHKSLVNWYQGLPDTVRKKINDAGFGDFMKLIDTEGRRDRKLLIALAERWWDSTHTFHFDQIGEMTMTPMDFSAITGIAVAGQQIEYDTKVEQKPDEIKKYLGEIFLNRFTEARELSYSVVSNAFMRDCKPKNTDEEDQLVRVFILCLLSCTLCAGKTCKMQLYYLPSLKDVSRIKEYNWGAAALASLYCNMDVVSRAKVKSIGSYWRAWEVWACEYITPLALNNPIYGPDCWPRGKRWFYGKDDRDTKHTVDGFRDILRNLKPEQVLIHPWGTDENLWPEYVRRSVETTKKRILLEGLAGYAWYLGERVCRQSMGEEFPHVPARPPKTMFTDYSWERNEIKNGLRGEEGSKFLNSNSEDYDDFRRKYIVYRHVPEQLPKIGDFNNASKTNQCDVTGIATPINSGPPGVVEVQLPPWTLHMQTDLKGGFMERQIPKNVYTNYLPLPEEAKYVPATQLAEMMKLYSGMATYILQLNQAFLQEASEKEKYKALYLGSSVNFEHASPINEGPEMDSTPPVPDYIRSGSAEICRLNFEHASPIHEGPEMDSRVRSPPVPDYIRSSSSEICRLTPLTSNSWQDEEPSERGAGFDFSLQRFPIPWEAGFTGDIQQVGEQLPIWPQNTLTSATRKRQRG